MSGGGSYLSTSGDAVRWEVREGGTTHDTGLTEGTNDGDGEVLEGGGVEGAEGGLSVGGSVGGEDEVDAAIDALDEVTGGVGDLGGLEGGVGSGATAVNHNKLDGVVLASNGDTTTSIDVLSPH